MNPGNDPMNHDSHDERFDHAMRALHTQALDQVSPGTRARLRVARQTAARPTGVREPRGGLGWVLASGTAAVFALVIGLQLRPQPAPVEPAPAVAAVATPTAFEVDTAMATLDENPDLYLWLASNGDAVATLDP